MSEHTHGRQLVVFTLGSEAGGEVVDGHEPSAEADHAAGGVVV